MATACEPSASSPDAPDAHLFARYLAHLASDAAPYRPATRENYASDARQFARWCDASARRVFDPDAARAWLAARAAAGARHVSTVRKDAALRAMYRWRLAQEPPADAALAAAVAPRSLGIVAGPKPACPGAARPAAVAATRRARDRVLAMIGPREGEFFTGATPSARLAELRTAAAVVLGDAGLGIDALVRAEARQTRHHLPTLALGPAERALVELYIERVRPLLVARVPRGRRPSERLLLGAVSGEPLTRQGLWKSLRLAADRAGVPPEHLTTRRLRAAARVARAEALRELRARTEQA